jgi:succinate dehydrogenase/fumarate reductase flavoprotein subunit
MASSPSTTSDPLHQTWDIIILGSGAAALTTALEALTTTSPAPRVLILEKSPESWAGGNGYFTAGAYRISHKGLPDILPLVSNVPPELAERVDLAPYEESEFESDLARVTGGRSEVSLGKKVVGEGLGLVQWLKEVGGVNWQMSFRRQAFEVDGRFKFWGGLCLTVEEQGKGLIRNLLKAVRANGGVVVFDVKGKEMVVDADGRVVGLQVESNGEQIEVRAGSTVLCAGGFEANPELRKKYLAEGWEKAHTRGTPYNTGDMMMAAQRIGAKLVGDFSSGGCHSTAWDYDSPADGGDREKTNEFTKSGYPLGIMVNSAGERFVDEGVDLRNYTYAKFGRAILEQPGGVAWQIWGKEGQKWLRDEEYRDEIVRKTWAKDVEELAEKLEQDGLTDKEKLVKTLHAFDEAVKAHREQHPDVELNPAIKDGLSTQSSAKKLTLAKSNWALPITQPSPLLAVKVTSGITFTFGGLAIDPEDAGILREDGSKIEGLHCAGEMVGGLFHGNYPGGSGLTAGGVFGRRAANAAVKKWQSANGSKSSKI